MVARFLYANEKIALNINVSGIVKISVDIKDSVYTNELLNVF